MPTQLPKTNAPKSTQNTQNTKTVASKTAQARTNTSTSNPGNSYDNYSSGNFDKYYTPASGKALADDVQKSGRSEDLWNEELLNRNLDREFGRQSQAFGMQSGHEKDMALTNTRNQQQLMNTDSFNSIRKAQVDAQNQLMLQQSAGAQERKTIKTSMGGGGGGGYSGGGGGSSAASDAAERAQAMALAERRQAADERAQEANSNISRQSLLFGTLKDTSYWR